MATSQSVTLRLSVGLIWRNNNMRWEHEKVMRVGGGVAGNGISESVCGFL